MQRQFSEKRLHFKINGAKTNIDLHRKVWTFNPYLAPYELLTMDQKLKFKAIKFLEENVFITTLKAQFIKEKNWWTGQSELRTALGKTLLK